MEHPSYGKSGLNGTVTECIVGNLDREMEEVHLALVETTTEAMNKSMELLRRLQRQ